ncbi:hypothetical protein BC827DRAFT_1239716 [Russula dissimulans]|nr:hypothetical protein BC827DRAFT_1239716 [Russula dissimulans]
MHVTIMSSQGLFHCLLPRSFVLASFSRPCPLFICVRSCTANLSPPIPLSSCRRFPFVFYFVAHLLQQLPAHQNASHQPRGHTHGLAQACQAIPTGLFRYCALSFRYRLLSHLISDSHSSSFLIPKYSIHEPSSQCAAPTEIINKDWARLQRSR